MPIDKVRASGNDRVFVTERGFSFGYNNLVVDMRAFPMMRGLGAPVVFDVTHSLQLPGGGDGVTAGLAEYIEPLARAGVGRGRRRRVPRSARGPARPRATRRTRCASTGWRRSSTSSSRSTRSSRPPQPVSRSRHDSGPPDQTIRSTWRGASSRPRRRRFSG